MAKGLQLDTLNSIARRAHYLANRMIVTANTRGNVEKGDPKIGGHSSATASALHILGALHLVAKSGFDWIANKPHASPADHSYNYLLDLLLDRNLEPLPLDQCNEAMASLRAFPKADEPTFQSYHSAYDPDHHNFYPSGTVGIPPVNAGYMALAYTYAKSQGFEVPDAHFWSIIGDSEFREGSLAEAIPDFGERQVGNLTWILDFNRQSLDGHRITNQKAMNGTDDLRVERMMEANGWHVVHARHGQKRRRLFEKDGGEIFKQMFEGKLSDYELQVLLLLKTGDAVREFLVERAPKLAKFLKGLKDDVLIEAVRDFGGHDFETLLECFAASKAETDRPSMVIAHTIKGWGLDMAASPGNHSALPEATEIEALAHRAGLSDPAVPFARFDADSPEGKFLKTRGAQLHREITEQHAIKARNQRRFLDFASEMGPIGHSMDLNFKMANFPHTQWMLGQLTAKLTRIANTPLDPKKLKDKQKPLSDTEKTFKLAGEMLISMAPDVGTSTNLNPAMDGKIFGANDVEDVETEMGVKDKTVPDLVAGTEVNDRFLRFDIAEANVMSCVGSFGKLRDTLGIPLIPLMTVYDFFIKRALDQLFYNLYWRSSFILVGTPSGVTLSPEGAQHGWKSDIQIPGQVTWEPFFVAELDWIFTDAMKRILTGDDYDRNGVVIRGVTRGIDQKQFLALAQTQARFKAEPDAVKLAPAGFEILGGTDESTVAAADEASIMTQLREDTLNGGYALIDYRGYQGYEPGDNVVHIFAMGSPTTEAVKASRALLARGVFANVFVVTSSDLLLGNLAHANDYHHLRHGLGINGDLHVRGLEAGDSGEVRTLAGRRIPIVSVHDGEIGLLDNIGSLVGVRQEVLAVRKHSKCGRPADVYRYHHIDADSVVEACGKILHETALENVVFSESSRD